MRIPIEIWEKAAPAANSRSESIFFFTAKLYGNWYTKTQFAWCESLRLPLSASKDSPSALVKVVAFARASQHFAHAVDFCLQIVQLREFFARHCLPPVRRRRAFAEAVEQPASVLQGEAARPGTLYHREPLQYRPVVLPAAAGPRRLRQHSRLLVKTDGRRRQSAALCYLADRHASSLLDLKFT